MDTAGPGTSITLLLFLLFPGAGRCDPDWGGNLEGRPSVRASGWWEEEGWRRRRGGARDWNGVVLSQACNARGHRSRNISCQAGSNGREGGQLDTDYPRSASDDPRGRPCKNWSSTSLLPSRFHLSCLWRRTHKKEYVTSADNSRLSLLGLETGGGAWLEGS